MSLTKVFNTLTNAAGKPLKGVVVGASLVRSAFNGQTEVIDTTDVKTNADGYWELELVPNEELNPANTYYTISEGGRSRWSALVPVSGLTHLRECIIDDDLSGLPWPVMGDKGPRGDKGLRGDQGERGERGLPGSQGDKGVRGDKGEQGERGIQGIQGIPGEQGSVGNQGAVGNKGPTGDKGLVGDQGIAGPQGIQGQQGNPGVQGEKGLAGDKGLPGNQGIQGIPGNKGIQGDKGVIGDKGPGGDAGPQGIQGIKGDKGETGTGISFLGIKAFPANLPTTGQTEGDAWIVESTNSLWVYDIATSWYDTEANIVGPQGNPGSQGIQGVKGDPGSQGIQGVKGDPGIQGPKGDPGAAGASGTTISIPASSVPYRNVSGTGEPNTSAPVAVSPINDSLALRNDSGQVRVGSATLVDSAVPYAQLQSILEGALAPLLAEIADLKYRLDNIDTGSPTPTTGFGVEAFGAEEFGDSSSSLPSDGYGYEEFGNVEFGGVTTVLGFGSSFGSNFGS